MAARVRIEWVTLGPAHGVIKEQFGPAIKLDASPAVTPAGQRPKAPVFGSSRTGYALVRVRDNPVVVRRVPAGTPAGDATELLGHLILPGEQEPILMSTDDELSCIEVAA